MASANVETIRRLLIEFFEGKSETAFEFHDPNIVWDGTRNRGRSSGAVVHQDAALVFGFEDGLIVRVALYPDHESAWRAVGLHCAGSAGLIRPVPYNARMERGVLTGWRGASERDRLLRFIQPGLIGLIDGTISTLAPIFAAAYLAGSREALLVGLAAALGAAISMGLSEGLSDSGEITGRGTAFARGLITGGATFVGGTAHALPFLISDIDKALTVAYVVVSIELVAIALVRKRYLQVPLGRSLIQVTLGGVIVAGVGVLVGQA